MQQASLSGEAEQGDQIGRIGPGTFPPPLDQPDVNAEFPGQTPPGQPLYLCERTGIAFLSAPDLTAPVSSSIRLPHPFKCARFSLYWPGPLTTRVQVGLEMVSPSAGKPTSRASPHPLTEERTFQHYFEITRPEPKKEKPRKAPTPKRTPEEQREARRLYERARNKQPERKEAARQHEKIGGGDV